MAVGRATEATTTHSWNKNSYYHPKIHYVTEGLKSSQSARQYLFQFNAFLRFLGYNVPSNIRDFSGRCNKEDYDQYLVKLLEMQPVQTEELIAEFLEDLRENKHLKAASINLAKSAIVHFFKRNRIRLNRDWLSGYVPAEEGYKEDRPYTREEIQQLLNACSEDRIRVAIYLMASTSMRIGAICHRVKEDMASVLEVGDLTWNSELAIYKIMVYNRSRGGRYTTYCTPECAKVIHKYLDYRRECGETITETSPLIREQFDPTDKLAISRPRKIQETTLTKVLRAVVKKAGLRDSLVRNVKLTHGFRKFAITQMNQAGVKDTHRRYLTGHAQVGQDASYVLPKEEDLLAEYVKAIPFLVIDQSKRLQKQVEKLGDEQAQKIASIISEVRSMKEEQQRMNERQAELVQQGYETWLELTLRDYKLQPLTSAEKQAREGCKTFQDLLRVGEAEAKAAAEAKLQQRQNQRWVEVGLVEKSDCGYLDDDNNHEDNSDGRKSRISMRFNR